MKFKITLKSYYRARAHEALADFAHSASLLLADSLKGEDEGAWEAMSDISSELHKKANAEFPLSTDDMEAYRAGQEFLRENGIHA